MRNLSFFVERNFALDSFDVYLREKTNGGFAYGQPVEMEEAGGGKLHHNPTLSLTPTEAQGLMNELWQAGVRPSNAEDKSEVVNAMQDHIDDLRKIALPNEED